MLFWKIALSSEHFMLHTGQVIYPGKVLNADCFRIGNIGHIFAEDMKNLLTCIEMVCNDMGMKLPINN